jgi:hypothetical protein
VRSLSLPQDSAGFVRRECPHCRRQFKSRPFPSDGVSVQRALSKLLPHENEHESGKTVTRRACLYCGRTAQPEEWLTGEQLEYLDKIAGSYAKELRYEQLAYVGQTLSLNPRPTFVPIVPERTNLTMPPEPDDLESVPLLCCGEDAKCQPGWSHSVSCPRCGARQQNSKRPSVSFEPVAE